MQALPYILLGIIGVIGGGAVSYVRTNKTKQKAKTKAETILKEAADEAKSLEKERKEKLELLHARLNEQIATNTDRLERLNKRLEILEKQASKWSDRLGKLEEEKQSVFDSWQANKRRHDEKTSDKISALTKLTGQDQTTILEEIQSKYLAEFQRDFDLHLQKTEYYAKENAVKIAQKILVGIMNRYSEPSSVDRLENTVTLANDKIKGVLIGKEGKNINYFETQAQVAIIFNDQAPNIVTVSCFHLLRREIARIALQKLSRQRTIDEKVIDQALDQARQEMDKQLEKIGLWAAEIIELPADKRDPELLKLMGRLKYRTSYGQNILYHSLEIAFFSAMMADEIGADTEIAKLGGFFHDLGKAVDQDDGNDKPHDLLSKEILERFDFSWEIVHAAWTHHDAIPIETVEAELVKAADAISAGRPGARAESAEDYYARIAALEEMALAIKGAEKVFAMSAGRELRIFLNPEAVKDTEMMDLASGLAHEIQDNLSYPGKVKVNLVRRLEAIDFVREKK